MSASIQPALLPTATYDPFNCSVDCTGTLIGWGATGVDEDLQDVFSTKQHALTELSLLDYEDCQNFAWQLVDDSPIGESNICTGQPGDTERGMCAGDQGAPLIQTRPLGSVLIGIGSWGFPICGASVGPSMYVSPKYFADWIQETMAANYP